MQSLVRWARIALVRDVVARGGLLSGMPIASYCKFIVYSVVVREVCVSRFEMSDDRIDC